MDTKVPEGAEEKKRRRSFAWPLCIGLIAASVWVCALSDMHYWANRRAGSAHMFYDRGLRLARAELALRTVAIQRFANKAGHLPESLVDCRNELIGIEDFTTWAAKNAGDDWENPLSRYRGILDEPWSQKGSYGSRPGAGFDLFGLPILYRRGPEANGEAWFRSTDPLPPEIEMFLRTRGGVPPVSPQSFALSSLFVQNGLNYLQARDRKAILATTLLWGGLALISLWTVWMVVRRWKSTKLLAIQRTGIMALGFIAFVVAGFGLTAVSATCYVMSRFSSRLISRSERLEILDDAVRRGEVPPDVAKTAREYIKSEGMP